MAGHLLAYERHERDERDGSWWAWVSWVHEAGGRRNQEKNESASFHTLFSNWWLAPGANRYFIFVSTRYRRQSQ